MFNESWPWKRDLWLAAERLELAKFELADRLDEAYSQTDENDDFYHDPGAEILYQVEHDLLFSAYAMRRLIGMPTKITQTTAASRINIVNFPLKVEERAPDFWDALGGIDMYDFLSPEDLNLTVQKVCNYLVHSLFLRFAWTIPELTFPEFWSLPADDQLTQQDPRELAGWLVASDYSSAKALTFVPLDEFARVMRRFAEDDVTALNIWTDSEGTRHYEAT